MVNNPDRELIQGRPGVIPGAIIKILKGLYENIKVHIFNCYGIILYLFGIQAIHNGWIYQK
ncbi:MAG: hypothetical protein A2X03_09905 [Bacteroidetes bacterium GWA2_40_15]|nr:MAG: hypothetical protein A2X03_09900 [Bacteroidetes bacterium GWA2_40_15]OFX39130.1 MAG: hypothetical protein A2X03_09905 [Bacteroidetes bacterium GWA2_40_15]